MIVYFIGSIHWSQSARQQQSFWSQEIIPVWKHEEFPSVDWMTRIRSAFFIFTGFIPKFFAFFLTSIIFITSPPL
jgi:hypothetical protein